MLLTASTASASILETRCVSRRYINIYIIEEISLIIIKNYKHIICLIIIIITYRLYSISIHILNSLCLTPLYKYIYNIKISLKTYIILIIIIITYRLYIISNHILNSSYLTPLYKYIYNIKISLIIIKNYKHILCLIIIIITYRLYSISIHILNSS